MTQGKYKSVFQTLLFCYGEKINKLRHATFTKREFYIGTQYLCKTFILNSQDFHVRCNVLMQRKLLLILSSALFMYQTWTLYQAGYLSEIVVLPIYKDNRDLLTPMTDTMLSGQRATC